MTTKNIVFVDARVSHYASFIDGLNDTAEVFVLDSAADGLGQMATWLKGRSGIDAIHVISHGSLGALVLGSTVLNGANLAAYGSQLADIGSALTLTGDILLYGCNVAQWDAGVQFITSLAQASGADVAASVNATGAVAQGGDWVLEHTTGPIEEPGLNGSSLAGTPSQDFTTLASFLTTNLKLNIMDVGAAGNADTAATPLLNWPFDQFKIDINGVRTTIDLNKAAVAAADTYEQMVNVFNTALAGTGIVATLGGTFTVTDWTGKTATGKSIVITAAGGDVFTINGGSGWYNTTGATVPVTSDIYLTYTIDSFVTIAPTDTSFSPADEATGVAITSDIVITFDEPIAKGVGNIVLKTTAGVTVASYDAATSNRLSFAGNELTINPSVDLAYSTGYKVEIAPGSIQDYVGNSYPGNTSYNFTTGTAPDTSAPVVLAFSPTDEATGVPLASNIVVTFSEAITQGTGTIVLKTAAGATIASYDAATSNNLSIAGSALTINPSVNLGYSTGYKVEFGNGTIKDLAGNAYRGSSSYNFTTQSAPNQTIGNDVLSGGQGDDSFDGGAGTDTAVFSGQFADYTISYDRLLGTATLTDHRTGGDGTDSLRNIEKLQFSDKTFDMTAQVFGAEAAVSTLNRAFANTSPGNATFNSQVASAKAQIASGADSTSMVSYLTYAKSFGAHYIDQTPFALASLLLTNMGLLPSTNATVLDLEPALGYYIQQVGVENVGIIALQLSSIISTFETKGGIFAVYNAPAVAWNKEVAAAYAYASNPANTSSLTDQVFYTLTADSPIMTEGNSGTKPLTFTLTLDQAPTSAVTVSYQTLTSGTATANVDFVAATSTVTFAVGQTKANVPITVNGDSVVEPNETVAVQFSGSSLKATVTATGIMTNDDIQYFVTAFSPTVDEGKSVSFVVSTSPPTPGLVVPYTLSGISAADLAGGALTGSVSLGSDGKATLLVALAADQFTEGAETLYATFQGASASVSVIDVSLTGQTDGGSDGSSGSGG
jgi:methionine-rich copper-binding protein CopC